MCGIIIICLRTMIQLVLWFIVGAIKIWLLINKIEEFDLDKKNQRKIQLFNGNIFINTLVFSREWERGLSFKHEITLNHGDMNLISK